MTIKERILTIIEAKGQAKSKFFEDTGIAASNFKGKGKDSDLGSSKLVKILSLFPDINSDWLLTGQGDMIRKDCNINDIQSVPHLATCNEQGIPLLPIEAMAGNLTTEQIVLEYECEKYVVPAFKGADFLMPVKGESMRPLYHSGDIVACKRVALNDLFFQWNKPYVIDSTQGPLIKRIKHGHDNAHISLVSENENYEPFELPIDALNGVSLVIGIIRLE